MNGLIMTGTQKQIDRLTGRPAIASHSFSLAGGTRRRGRVVFSCECVYASVSRNFNWMQQQNAG
jgi:hypothetical protein